MRGLYHAGSCVIGLIDNKKSALGGFEKAQALRSFLMPTSDSKPAMMPSSHSSHSGLVGTGVVLSTARASFSQLKLGNFFFTLFFANKLETSTADENSHCYVLFYEIVFTRFWINCNYIRGEFRFCGYFIFLTRLYGFIKKT